MVFRLDSQLVQRYSALRDTGGRSWEGGGPWRALLSLVVRVLLPPGALLLAACGEPTKPRVGPPYIAIYAVFTMQEGLSEVPQFRYTVEELSGTLSINRSFVVASKDTVVLSVPPASYIIEVHDLPPTCTVRDGPKRLLTLLDTDNTGTLRYVVQCVPSLTVEVLMDGSDIDDAMVYRMRGAGRTASASGSSTSAAPTRSTPGATHSCSRDSLPATTSSPSRTSAKTAS